VINIKANRYAKAKLRADKYYKLIKFTSDEDSIIMASCHCGKGDCPYCGTRRVWNIEIGEPPVPRAEKRIKEWMEEIKKSMSYDPKTGEVFCD